MKVLLVGDHPLILSALQSILQSLSDDMEVSAAEGPQQAFDLLARDADHALALLDLALGDGVDGFALLAELRQRHPGLPVVVVSGTDRLADVVRAVDMGAMGFVPKRTSNDELARALAMVSVGGVYIPPVLLDLITRMQRRGELGDTTISAATAQLAALDAARADAAGAGSAAAPASPPGPPPGPPPGLGLTPRQTDVLGLLLEGLPNKLIARQLNVSVETVKDHVAAVLRALGVNSRTQAVLAVNRLNQQGAALPPAVPVRPVGR